MYLEFVFYYEYSIRDDVVKHVQALLKYGLEKSIEELNNSMININ